MKPRYVTSGINATLPPETQMRIWAMYDAMQGERDYLQVFRLSELQLANAVAQRIEQSAEDPEYKASTTLLRTTPVNTKVYVIDDGDHVTMLLAEEY